MPRQRDAVSTVKHYIVGETPVAVSNQEDRSARSVNKISAQLEGLNERKMIKEREKKTTISTLRSMPSVGRKPSTRGRKRLNHIQVTGRQLRISPDIENTNHKLTEHFTVDETPVAVPVHGPPTPHRINMPNGQLEDSSEDYIIKEKEEKSERTVITSPIQPIVKKTGIRGRKKGNQAQVTNRQVSQLKNVENTNHKLTDYFPVRRSERKSKKVVLQEKQRDLEHKVLSQVEEGLKVQHFPSKGRGVVTTRQFMKGEFVVEYIGELIDQVMAKKREALYAQDHNTGCYMYYFQHRNHQYCVDATAETDKLGRLVNHSRNGNLIARVVEVDSIPHLVLTAKEDIPIGVEVTYDYGDRSREAIRNHPWLAL